MSTLRDAYRKERERYDALRVGIWLAWLGNNWHLVRLASGQAIAAKGGSRTFAVGDACTIGKMSGGSNRDWVLLAQPPPDRAGASSFPEIQNAAEAVIIDIVAVNPQSIEVYVPTTVEVIGLGFVESPLTTFAAWDPVASDPATETWVVDPNVTLASPLWVANPDPGQVYAAYPLLIIQLTITATVPLVPISLRITS